MRTQDLDGKWILHLAQLRWGKSPQKYGLYRYSVPAHETAKYRAKFGWPPLSDVAVVTKPRLETCSWNLLGCPKLANRCQPLVGRSSPYCENMWRSYCCLTFFPIVDTCLRCEDIARQSCAMVCRWLIFAYFCVLYFQRAAYSTFQTCILNSHQGHVMCGSMVDIQSATAENRRGKRKKEERKKETTNAKYKCRVNRCV